VVLSPTKFSKEIADEQAKYQGKCLYHLTKSHQTCECHVLKEGDKAGNSTKNSGQASGTTQLQHITEELLDDIEAASEELGNDTNDESLQYFARVSNHYLRLVKSSQTETARHDVTFPIIADSGANYHMFKELIFFDSLVPATGRVILGDGKTSLPIQGIGTIRLLIDGNKLFVDNVRYIPNLSESIYSLFLHVKCPNHGLQSSYDHGLHISFPTFTTQAVLGEHDIYLNAVPGNTTIKCPSLLPPTSTSSTTAISSICRHIKSASSVLCTESTQRDNILTSLRQYYDDIKTKRQLNFEVPAGFRREGYFQRMVRDVKNSSRVDLPSDDCLRNPLPPTTPIHADDSQDINFSDSLPNESSPVSVPILRCVDKPSSHLPARITLTEDFIRASVGFRHIEMMKSHLKQLYQDTIIIDTLPADAVLDQGELPI
jgi:hypothetical protein